ncbi:MAG: branched-chain amino acid ABC transporter permease [Deltaproteobacteria bacterium]|nr:branched-chain amino acid ABC transporter permease [Candidatus Anaeroferrophillus wilburensis]MBN2888836.1 branched-chain amino acid ABC transporter permease [Deltaproteobacteria bacterium]
MSANICGDYKTSYKEDMVLFQTTFSKFWIIAFVLALYVVPLFLGNYVLYVANMICIAVIGALGINILTGFTGQISLGHGAFIGIGAYTSGYLTMKLGVPFIVALPAAGVVTALFGMVFGIPSLRLKGLYLAIATLAAQFIIEYLMVHLEPITNGVLGLLVDYPSVFGFSFDTDLKYFYLTVSIAILATLYAKNLIRTRPGRAFIAIRDRYISAEVMGVNLFKYKLMAFGISSFLAGIAGSLWAHYVTIITPEHFTIGVSIEYLAMIIIGGLGHLIGAIYGAIFMVLLPEVLRLMSESMSGQFPMIVNMFAAIKEGIFGAIIIGFLVYEPDGLAHRWQMIKAYWKLWPFSY